MATVDPSNEPALHCPDCGRFMKAAWTAVGGLIVTCTNGDHDVDYE